MPSQLVRNNSDNIKLQLKTFLQGIKWRCYSIDCEGRCRFGQRIIADFAVPFENDLCPVFLSCWLYSPKEGRGFSLERRTIWYWSWRQLGIFCVELDFLNTKFHQELKPCWGRWATGLLMEQVRLGDPGWAITIAFANVNFSKIKLIKSYLKVKINHVTRIFSELCPKKKKKT